jgi:hypothetical protein
MGKGERRLLKSGAGTELCTHYMRLYQPLASITERDDKIFLGYFLVSGRRGRSWGVSSFDKEFV